jgi:hypothetical protein
MRTERINKPFIINFANSASQEIRRVFACAKKNEDGEVRRCQT